MLKTFDLAVDDRRELLLDKDRLHALGRQFEPSWATGPGCARCGPAAEGRCGRGAGEAGVTPEAMGLAILAALLIASSVRSSSRRTLSLVLWLALPSPGGVFLLPRPSSCRRPGAALCGRRRHHRRLRDHADRAAGREISVR
jgi:hypothetical protein